MGKKYIIELEDKPFNKGGDFLYRVKGFNSLVFDMTGIGKLTPYTEPDLEQVRKEAYEKGQKDLRESCVPQDEEAYSIGYHEGFQCGLGLAWGAARKIILDDTSGGFSSSTFRKIFGYEFASHEVLKTLNAAEAIEKIRQYEQRQKESEEPKKEKSITAEDVMRQYLDTFCAHSKCTGCPLHTPDFTCGRGYHFLTHSRISDEEVRRAYAEVLQKMEEN